MQNSPLDLFLNLNSVVEKVEETEHINLNKLWGDDSFMCRFEKSENVERLVPSDRDQPKEAGWNCDCFDATGTLILLPELPNE